MKAATWVVLFVLCPAYLNEAAAAEAWLLVYREGHHAVERVVDSEHSTIVDIGDRTVFGISESLIALLSRGPSNWDSTFRVIDTSTGRVKVTLPVRGHPVAQQSGPSNEIVLANGFAYFVTISFETDGETVKTNELGGSFDFYRVSLGSGGMERFPLPRECRNPRLINYGGTPLVYSWNGEGVWSFDSASGEVTEILSPSDLEDTLIVSRNEDIPAARPTEFADFVAVPDLGVFRFSKLGVLSRVLASNLSLAMRSQSTQDLVLKTRVVRMMPAWIKNEPAIGVLRQEQESQKLVFAFVNPDSMQVVFELPLPSSVVPDSIYVSQSGAIYYVDRESAAIYRTSGAGATSLFSLNTGDPPVDLNDLRILRLETTDY